ncbi:MAG: CRISPR-associated protein Cas4 [Candidatus Brocadiia bacterium]
MDEQEPDDQPTVLLSMLQHYSYCPRQCGLIHLEDVFDENIYTLRGRSAHRNVDVPGSALRDGVRVVRALPLWSERYGLRGKADIVEFTGDGPYPVEYKHGKRISRKADEVQLCAQALCLQEMTGNPVPRGAIYHHSSRARREVALDQPLRERTIRLVADVRNMLRSRRLLPAPADARCANCSLRDACLPESAGKRTHLAAYVQRLFQPADSPPEPTGG